MSRTLEELVAAIEQMRDYAFAYKGKREEFYQNLYAMLVTPIPRNENYENNVNKMYLAAVGALTAQIQPPTAETYDKVVEKLNSVLSGEKIKAIHIATAADDAFEEGYQVVGNLKEKDDIPNRDYGLRLALPAKRKLTKKNQALVEKFREELPATPLRFGNRGQRRGEQS